MEEKPISVIETPEFLTVTRRIMDDEERAVLIDYLAYNPGAGDLIRGTGGVRKLRWGLAGRGKRGGARVIYFYHKPQDTAFRLDGLRQGPADRSRPGSAAGRRAGSAPRCSRFR